MKHAIVVGVFVSVLMMWTGISVAEAPSFDPDQPFRQAFSSQMLRTFLNRALDVLDDHIEVAGDVSASNSEGDQSAACSSSFIPKANYNQMST